MTELETCINCGHHKSFHTSSGGLTFCSALERRFPKKEFCKCKSYTSDYILSVTPETRELVDKVARGKI